MAKIELPEDTDRRRHVYCMMLGINNCCSGALSISEMQYLLVNRGDLELIDNQRDNIKEVSDGN